MKSFALYIAAAAAEIAGCFAFWAWLRGDKSALWVIPGLVALTLFAFLLTKVDSLFAGRAYAAYGGVYIFVAILWLWGVDGIRPTGWDIVGSLVALTGMAIIMFAPRQMG